MRNSKILKIILFVAGLNLIVLGLWRLLDPVSFCAFSGILLSNDVTLLNEMRAGGGGIVGFGLLIFLGTFIEKLRYTSTIVAFTLFLSYGLARVLSLGLDGPPAMELYKGIIGEFVMGSIILTAFIRYRKG